MWSLSDWKLPKVYNLASPFDCCYISYYALDLCYHAFMISSNMKQTWNLLNLTFLANFLLFILPAIFLGDIYRASELCLWSIVTRFDGKGFEPWSRSIEPDWGSKSTWSGGIRSLIHKSSRTDKPNQSQRLTPKTKLPGLILVLPKRAMWRSCSGQQVAVVNARKTASSPFMVCQEMHRSCLHLGGWHSSATDVQRIPSCPDL